MQLIYAALVKDYSIRSYPFTRDLKRILLIGNTTGFGYVVKSIL